MSYTKVLLGGKERGLKFNNLAILIMNEKTNKEFQGLTVGYAMVYGGLIGNCYVKGEEADFTFEDVVTWVDAMSLEDSQKISDAFMESEIFKKSEAFKETAEKQAKKKTLKN
jgi:hypothetical protein